MTSAPPKHVRQRLGLDAPGSEHLIATPYLTSWLRNLTLGEVPPAPSRPAPRHAQRGLDPFLIPLETKPVVLWRLTENGYAAWFTKTLPILEDYGYVFNLLTDLRWAGRGLDLPYAYAVLARRFGRSSLHLDEWKHSFTFPFLLVLEHQGQAVRYLMTIVQCRSGLDFRFRRELLGAEACDPHAYHPPFPAEFSRDEMNGCVGFLLEYLALTFHTDPDAHAHDFHLIVPSDHIAYGCRQGVFYLGQELEPGRFQAHAQDAAYWQSKCALSKPTPRCTVSRGRPAGASIRSTLDGSEARLAASIQAHEYAEGRVEGQTQAMREDVLEVLEVRFGEIPYALREQILAIVGEAELKRLHRQAVLLPDLPTFQRALLELKAG